MSQPTSLSAGSALGRQTCFVKHNINLSACSAPGRQTCRLAHEDFCLKNWAIMYIRLSLPCFAYKGNRLYLDFYGLLSFSSLYLDFYGLHSFPSLYLDFYGFLSFPSLYLDFYGLLSFPSLYLDFYGLLSFPRRRRGRPVATKTKT
jgi:hypothetical protein